MNIKEPPKSIGIILLISAMWFSIGFLNGRAYDKGQFTHPKTEKPELILRLDVTLIEPDWILI
jgi:hypothetical protein